MFNVNAEIPLHEGHAIKNDITPKIDRDKRRPKWSHATERILTIHSVMTVVSSGFEMHISLRNSKKREDEFSLYRLSRVLYSYNVTINV